MIVVLLLSGVLVVSSVGTHLLVLQALHRMLRWVKSLTRLNVGIMLVGAILGHLVEICWFALGIALLSRSGRYGQLHGIYAGDPSDFFYYSAVTFTSLGFGDLTPTGELRILAAVEALTGLVLITWTASFALIVMQEYWLKKSE